MDVNTTIYGAPETWTTAQYMAGAKYANFGTIAAPKNTLLEGSTAGKTPTGKLLENSICTQALGKESLYSNVLWVHDYGSDVQYVMDEQPQTPFFYAECVSTDNNSQNNESSIYPTYNCNSWKPYITDDYYENKSATSRPIVEYDPKKTVYILRIIAENEQGTSTQTAIIGNYVQYPQFRQNYPYLKAAFLSPYVDKSSTTTPSREEINYNALYGMCPNYEINADTEDIKINYAFWRSCNYNTIPIWGVFGSFNYFDDRYTGALCDPSDLVISDNTVSARRRITDELLEYLIQQAACFGVYVKTGTAGNIANVALDHDSIILGLLDSDGVGHGEYTRGAANRTNPIWDWETNRDSPYNPYKIPDPNTYSDTTTFNYIGGLSSMFKRYVLNAAGVDALGQQLFKVGDDIVTAQGDNYENYQNIVLNNFLTNNPIDAIISLKKFPLANIPHVDTSEQLRLGKKQISVIGYRFPYTNFRYLFGAIDVFPRFENTFLDYAPYTTLEIYVPFCGTKELDAGVYMGHKLSVELQIDFTTGSCDAYIKCDNLVTDTLSGQCAIDIPVTGTESATVDSQITNGILQGQSARAKNKMNFGETYLTISGLKNNVFNPYGSAANRFETMVNRTAADYNVSHTQASLRSVGTSTPVGGWTIDFNCRLFITYPTGSVIRDSNPPSFNDVEIKQYGHINGFATVEAATMANFKIPGAPSFVVADSINLDGIAATETEKDLIRAACKEGCYI